MLHNQNVFDSFYSSRRIEKFNDFIDLENSLKSDSFLISCLGFSPRNKKRSDNFLSRNEEDYLNCYYVYLTSEMYNNRKSNENFNKFKQAIDLLEIILYRKRIIKYAFNEKQSIALAKLKKVIRIIIVEYVNKKHGINCVIAA